MHIVTQTPECNCRNTEHRVWSLNQHHRRASRVGWGNQGLPATWTSSTSNPNCSLFRYKPIRVRLCDNSHTQYTCTLLSFHLDFMNVYQKPQNAKSGERERGEREKERESKRVFPLRSASLTSHHIFRDRQSTRATCHPSLRGGTDKRIPAKSTLSAYNYKLFSAVWTSPQSKMTLYHTHEKYLPLRSESLTSLRLFLASVAIDERGMSPSSDESLSAFSSASLSRLGRSSRRSSVSAIMPNKPHASLFTLYVIL